MTAPVHPADLLRNFEATDGNLFLSPRGALCAQGLAGGLREDERAAGRAGVLPAARRLLAEAADDGRPELLTGALPFSPAAAAYLVAPRSTHWSEPAFDLTGDDEGPLTLAGAPTPTPGFERAVEEALRRMSSDGLEKVVLARALDLQTDGRVDLPAVVRRLARRDPAGYTFALGLPASGGRARTLVGASPELLVSRAGSTVRSNPLAGSVPRHPDPAVDRRRAEELLASHKNLREHALVADAVRDGLAPFCTTLHARGPYLVQTARMWHLATEVVGEVSDPSVSSLELALALHPTPAVCGSPTAAAREVIEELEPFDRDFYTGALGWCDSSGDGEWVVTIRCAEVQDDSVRLYAGAGVVPGSDPAAEYAETSAKLGTMLEALGLQGAL